MGEKKNKNEKKEEEGKKAQAVLVYQGKKKKKEAAMSGGPLGCLSVFLVWHVKAPSSACHVSNLSFDMSGTIIPSFVTSFDQRMKNRCLTQTKLLLKKRATMAHRSRPR